MAEELDAQEPEVQVEETPTAEQVPQQALFEPRNIAEAMALPDPPPAPEPAPAPEPENPPIVPDWLNAPVAPPQQEYPQEQFPQQPPGYYEQPQYPAQTQAPPRTGKEAAFESFLDDPEAFIARVFDQRGADYVAPLHQQQQSVAYMMNNLVENNVKQGVSAARGKLQQAYNVFNQDSTFRSNKAMQDKISATLEGMVQNAEAEARLRGNWEPLNSILNLSEAEIRGTLAFAREVAGIGSQGAAPLQVEGATVESARAPVAEQTVELTPEQEEIARRMGPGYRNRLIEAEKERQKYDDLEWND